VNGDIGYIAMQVSGLEAPQGGQSHGFRADPGFHFTLDPGNGPSAQLDGLRKLPKADVLVDRRSSQPSAIHDVFDADKSIAHDELLLFVHEIRQVSIF
jgi:hypothetical protein